MTQPSGRVAGWGAGLLSHSQQPAAWTEVSWCSVLRVGKKRERAAGLEEGRDPEGAEAREVKPSSQTWRARGRLWHRLPISDKLASSLG